MKLDENALNSDNGLLIQENVDDFDVSICLSEDVLHRFFGVWKGQYLGKKMNFSGSYLFHERDLRGYHGWILDNIVDVLTLGIVDVDITVKKTWLDYKGGIKLDTLAFDLLGGNRVNIKGSGVIDFKCALYVMATVVKKIDTSGFIPDSWTPWEDDFVLGRKKRKIQLLCQSVKNLKINVNRGVGRVGVDSKNRLFSKIEDVDLSIDYEWGAPDFLVNHIVNILGDMCVEHFPKMTLSPQLFATEIPDSGASLVVEVNDIDIQDKHVCIKSKIKIIN